MALSPARWLSGGECRHYGFLPSVTQGLSQQTLLPSGRQGLASGDHRPGWCQR